MSNFSVNKKAPGLTADRYKLLQPCHVHRDGTPLPATKHVATTQDETTKDAPYQMSLPKLSSQMLNQRLFMIPSKNATVQSQINLVKQYFDETELQKTMQVLTIQLLQNSLLPYNPYPGYIKRFGRIAQRFYTGQQPLSAIEKKLENPVFNADKTFLKGVKIPNVYVWGLEHIVSHVDPKTMESYRPILTATISNEAASTAANQQVTVFKSLFGPGIFCNTFYPDLNNVDLKISVLISGLDIRKTARAFALVVIEDVKQALLNQSQQLLELSVDVKNSKGWSNHFISRDDIANFLSHNQERVATEKLIAEAVVNKRRVSLKLLSYNTANQVAELFVIVTKVYDMMFLQQDRSQPNTIKSPGHSSEILVLTTFPYQALLEGVFLDLSQAEMYVSTFQKYSSFQGASLKSRKATKTSHPFDPDILYPLVEAWQTKIASVILEHSPLSTIHYMMMVYLAQIKGKLSKNQDENNFVIQVKMPFVLEIFIFIYEKLDTTTVCRFYSGTPTRLQCASLLVDALFDIISSNFDQNDVGLVQVLQSLKIPIQNAFEQCCCSSSPERRMLENLLESLYQPANAFGDVQNKKKLQQLSCCMTLAALSATESCLENFPAILSFKAQINAKYPQVIPSFVDIADQPRKQHGIKNSSWINVDNAKIDKTKSIANSQAPSTIAAQYSVMQYCMDIRLDQVWKELMEYLLLESDHLPPNPYSHAVSLFRKASMSVQIFFEPDSNAASQIIQRKLAPVEGLSEVFNVSGTSGYGRRSSLIFFSTLGFRKLSALVPSLFLSPPGEGASGLAIQLGQFRLTVASGLVAPCPYYGSMSPYLYSIEIDEHLFLVGPPDQSRIAFSQLAQTVLSHLLQLRSQGAVLHQINFGQVKLDLFVLVYSASRFESEFSATVEGNHSVLLSFYYPVSWRYVLVRKRLMVYLTDHATNRTTRMFQLASSTEKRGTTVFLHPLDANISIRPGRIIAQSIASTIKSSWPSRNWPRIVTQLAMQAQLMTSGSESKIDLFAGNVAKESQSNILTAFCYRYYNALPGQIDYLLSLNDSLETLIGIAVSTLDERKDLSSVVNLPLMDKMVEEYMIKLKQITSTPSALAPTSFSDFLLSKLRTVAQRDPNSNVLHISYTNESIKVLCEVNEYLTVLRNLLTDDLLKVSPAISNLISNQLAS